MVLPALALIATLLIALPGLLIVARATPGVSDAPPALDRFLGAVRDATPPTARILVAGNPPGTVFYRAVYLLYPRIVYTAFATDFTHHQSAPLGNWSELSRIARRRGVDDVLLWSLPLRPHVSARVRQGAGTLVLVRP